jgi:hypothetical protein
MNFSMTAQAAQLGGGNPVLPLMPSPYLGQVERTEMDDTLTKPRVHGNNQSVDTKYATVLVDDALTFIESGRIQKGVDLLRRVLTLLPDLGLERQEAYKNKRIECSRGFK